MGDYFRVRRDPGNLLLGRVALAEPIHIPTWVEKLWLFKMLAFLGSVRFA
jgi:hypothetical protein